MKNCTDCKHAQWKRTAAGKMHPSGDGECGYPWKLPALPRAFYWTSSAPHTPSGGIVNRRKTLPDHCTYFARTERT